MIYEVLGCRKHFRFITNACETHYSISLRQPPLNLRWGVHLKHQSLIYNVEQIDTNINVYAEEYGVQSHMFRLSITDMQVVFATMFTLFKATSNVAADFLQLRSLSNGRPLVRSESGFTSIRWFECVEHSSRYLK